MKCIDKPRRQERHSAAATELTRRAEETKEAAQRLQKQALTLPCIIASSKLGGSVVHATCMRVVHTCQIPYRMYDAVILIDEWMDTETDRGVPFNRKAAKMTAQAVPASTWRSLATRDLLCLGRSCVSTVYCFSFPYIVAACVTETVIMRGPPW